MWERTSSATRSHACPASTTLPRSCTGRICGTATSNGRPPGPSPLATSMPFHANAANPAHSRAVSRSRSTGQHVHGLRADQHQRRDSPLSAHDGGLRQQGRNIHAVQPQHVFEQQFIIAPDGQAVTHAQPRQMLTRALAAEYPVSQEKGGGGACHVHRHVTVKAAAIKGRSCHAEAIPAAHWRQHGTRPRFQQARHQDGRDRSAPPPAMSPAGSSPRHRQDDPRYGRLRQRHRIC